MSKKFSFVDYEVGILILTQQVTYIIPFIISVDKPFVQVSCVTFIMGVRVNEGCIVVSLENVYRFFGSSGGIFRGD